MKLTRKISEPTRKSRLDFAEVIDYATYDLRYRSDIVQNATWQGVDVSSKPEMATHEVRHVLIRTHMPSEDLEYYREQIKPNLPWADDHFEERVCGMPINPGVEWARWPWGQSAKNFLDKTGRFNHNYMERYWPKFAGRYDGPANTANEVRQKLHEDGNELTDDHANGGIYHPLGDLRDVVEQLLRDPLTRQAVLPVFFPEDTGAVHGGRVPCSLTYQFIMRNNCLDVSYVIRSCDFKRHFRDDIYLTVRLARWVLHELRKRDPNWNKVSPGQYVMLITSLHCFRNDYKELWPS